MGIDFDRTPQADHSFSFAFKVSDDTVHYDVTIDHGKVVFEEVHEIDVDEDTLQF